MNVTQMTTDEIINAFKADFAYIMNVAQQNDEVNEAVNGALAKGMTPQNIRKTLVAGAFVAWLVAHKRIAAGQ